MLNRHSTPQQIALRGRIILLADEGKNNREIGRELNISRLMARRWRERWLELSERSLPVIERLLDGERSGTPARFSMEQVVELFALLVLRTRRLRTTHQPLDSKGTIRGNG